jgi:hypothetical protein
VFGPDAVDSPEAWFKHAEPHDLWGIFPRLAYEVFKNKQDGWKISMKYFQNVVDTVRDLMSPVAKEMNYKSGMCVFMYSGLEGWSFHCVDGIRAALP